MKVILSSELAAQLDTYLEASADAPVVIVKDGQAVAALIAVSDDEELERLVLGHTARFRRLLADAEERIRHSGGLSHEEFWDAVAAPGDAGADDAVARPEG